MCAGPLVLCSYNNYSRKVRIVKIAVGTCTKQTRHRLLTYKDKISVTYASECQHFTILKLPISRFKIFHFSYFDNLINSKGFATHFLIKFILKDLLVVKVTGYDVTMEIPNQFSFVCLNVTKFSL